MSRSFQRGSRSEWSPRVCLRSLARRRGRGARAGGRWQSRRTSGHLLQCRRGWEGAPYVLNEGTPLMTGSGQHCSRRRRCGAGSGRLRRGRASEGEASRCLRAGKNGVPSEWQRKRLLAETFSCPWTHGRSAAEAVITVITRQMAESRRAKCERGMWSWHWADSVDVAA